MPYKHIKPNSPVYFEKGQEEAFENAGIASASHRVKLCFSHGQCPPLRDQGYFKLGRSLPIFSWCVTLVLSFHISDISPVLQEALVCSPGACSGEDMELSPGRQVRTEAFIPGLGLESSSPIAEALGLTPGRRGARARELESRRCRALFFLFFD